MLKINTAGWCITINNICAYKRNPRHYPNGMQQGKSSMNYVIFSVMLTSVFRHTTVTKSVVPL